MKVTLKGIAANVVTVKFTLACKCHILADLKKKKCQFLETKIRFAKNSIQVLAGCFLFQISYIHNLPGSIKYTANAKGYLRPLGFQFNLS